MNDTQRTVADLVAYPTELPWLEFKENWFEPHVLREYILALSNAVALAGCAQGHMVWGVNDVTHEIVGTDFAWHPEREMQLFKTLIYKGQRGRGCLSLLLRLRMPSRTKRRSDIPLRGRRHVSR